MNKKTFFISTAIDYPSGKPHLGHCLEKIQADVIARYKRLQGFDVHFSVGTDEHGLKIQRYSQIANKNSQEFVDEISKSFKDLWKLLNISNDDFIRTTEQRHINVVQEIIDKIYKKGDIYRGKYKGLYCTECETYYLPKDLDNNMCPIHKKEVEIVNEDCYFFRMSRYQNRILKHIKEDKNFIIPDKRRNEILSRLKDPLQDLSISRRNVDWGIPFLFDKNLTLFVWIDALINYLTTIGYPAGKFKKFWPVNVHIIGKDIIWHHCVIWPSLLLSLELPLPKNVFVHGYITSNGEKMSKSLGNVIDPFELIKKYGVDPVRYFLLREFSSTEDGDFTYEKFEERYNSDLANGLGNLVSRVLTLAEKFNVKKTTSENELEKKPRHKAPTLELTLKIAKGKCAVALNEFKFNEALATIWSLITDCDKYIENVKPWEDIQNKKEEIASLVKAIEEIAKLLKPFLPETSEKIIKQLKENKAKALFPRI